MLAGFKSLWIMGGLHPSCRYSNPKNPKKLLQCKGTRENQETLKKMQFDALMLLLMQGLRMGHVN